MRSLVSFLVCLVVLLKAPLAWAQTPAPAAAPKGSKDVLVSVLVIDKVAGQPQTLQVTVGTVVNFRTLSILPRRCSVNDEGQFAALVEIYDQPPSGGTEEVFSGWMFSASPSLTHIEHPFYDVSLLKCEPRKEEKKEAAETAPKNKTPTAQ